MKKKSKIFLTKRTVLIILLLSIIILLSFLSLKFTGFVVKNEEYVRFYFYDNITDCNLDGYLFFDDELIGKSKNGYFNLSYDLYNRKFQNITQIALFGVLGECFQDSDLYFDRYWHSFDIKKDYFNGESTYRFKTTINPRMPVKREFQGFIQPEKLESELDKIILSDNPEIDLSRINNYLSRKIEYVSDWQFNSDSNYWQTPLETLNKSKGDCEDYSVALLSLFSLYKPWLNCYNLILSSHVTTFCYYNNIYGYYDLGKTKLTEKISDNDDKNKILSDLRDLKKEYILAYGFNDSDPEVLYAFNKNEYYEFDPQNDSEFYEWQYSLINKKQTIDNFILFNQKLYFMNNEDSENESNISEFEELGSLKPNISSSENNFIEIPSFKGFVDKNVPILIISLILFVIFVVILIILIRN